MFNKKVIRFPVHMWKELQSFLTKKVLQILVGREIAELAVGLIIHSPKLSTICLKDVISNE